MRIEWPCLVLVVAACTATADVEPAPAETNLLGQTGDTDDPDPTGSNTTGTGTGSGTGTGTGSGTGTGTGTGTGSTPPWVLSGTLQLSGDGPPPKGDIQVVLVDAGSQDFGDVYQSVNVGPLEAGSVDWAFDMPPQLPPSMYVLDLESGLDIAAVSVGAYVDEDGDDVPGAGDTYLAADLDSFAHIDSPGTPAYDGWVHVDVDPESFEQDIVFVFGDVTDHLVPTNLLAVAPGQPLTATVVGQLDPAPPGERRADLYVMQGLYPAEPNLASAPIVDDAVTWIHPLPLPPADHFFTDPVEIPGLELALYQALAYADDDGNGLLDPLGEPVLGSAVAQLVYVQVNGFDGARIAVWGFGGLGWRLMVEPDNGADPPILLPWQDGVEILPL